MGGAERVGWRITSVRWDQSHLIPLSSHQAPKNYFAKWRLKIPIFLPQSLPARVIVRTSKYPYMDICDCHRGLILWRQELSSQQNSDHERSVKKLKTVNETNTLDFVCSSLQRRKILVALYFFYFLFLFFCFFCF